MFVMQLAVAVPGAVSVVVPDDAKVTLYVLAIVGAALLGIWWILSGFYESASSAAQAARRGALLLGGLNQALSPSEIESLRERFTVTTETARANEKADYYATTREPGPARLGEMLEESALYSEQLQRISAHAMLGVLVLFVAGFLVIALASTPFVDRDTAYILVRVFLAMLVFVMSSDVLGAYRRHVAAAKEIREIRQRLKIADRSGYPLPDVLLAMTDYNAAVERAPESVPFAYRLRAKHLDQRWRDYQADRAVSRAER
jgi:hypothetical protein